MRRQGNCHDDHVCMTHHLWSNLNQRIYAYLDSVSLEALVKHQVRPDADMTVLKSVRRRSRMPSARDRRGLRSRMNFAPSTSTGTRPRHSIRRCARPCCPGSAPPSRRFGNASSRHEYGCRARAADEARAGCRGGRGACYGGDLHQRLGSQQSLPRGARPTSNRAWWR